MHEKRGQKKSWAREGGTRWFQDCVDF